jgi:MFS family permease
VLPLSFGIVRDEFPEAKVAGAIGVIAALSAVGAGLGLVLGGPIVEALSFRWLFWFPMLALLLTLVACYLVVAETPRQTSGGINWLAAGLLSVWLVALLLPLSDSAQWGWMSVPTLALLGVAAVVAGVWYAVERRSAHPLVDMGMMRIPVVWSNNLVALLFGVGMYSVLAFLPQFLQTPSSTGYGFGASVTESGLFLLPSTMVMFVAGLMCGRLTLRFGGKAVLVTGATIAIIPLLLLVVAAESKWVVVGAMAIMGAGFGMAFAAMSSLIVEGVPIAQTGVASGMNANIRTIGGSVGTAVMVSVVTASAHGTGVPTAAGYQHGFIMLTGAAVGAAVASLLVPGGLRPPSRAQLAEALPHPEAGLVAGATLLGDRPE